MSGRVPLSSRAGRRSKSARSAVIRKAASLYERFTGHEPEEIGRLKIPDLPAVVAIIGECDGVLYTTVRDGKTEHYIHEFADSDKPMLAVSPDGRQLILIGGRYKFTERGIVDTSDKSR